METPPSDVRDTITPGKRPISGCSIGRPGGRAMSSPVTTGPEGAVGGSGLDLDAVDHVQRLGAAADRGGAADTHRYAAVWGARHGHAGKTAHQRLLDRLARLAVEVFPGYNRACRRRGRTRAGVVGTAR